MPAEYDNYVFLSNLYNSAGRMLDSSYYEKAVEIADRGVEVEPFGPAVRVQRARALAALGRTEEALKDAQFAVEMDLDYAEARLLLASILEDLGRNDEALDVLNVFNDRKPEAGRVCRGDRQARGERSLAPTATTP